MLSAEYARAVMRARIIKHEPQPARNRLVEHLSLPVFPVVVTRIVPHLSDEEYVSLLYEWTAGLRPIHYRRTRDFNHKRGLDVLDSVALYFGITRAEICGRSRTPKYTIPRHIVMYVCVRGLGYSYPQTGLTLGGFDHTTVLHAVRSLSERLANGSPLNELVGQLMAAVSQP